MTTASARAAGAIAIVLASTAPCLLAGPACAQEPVAVAVDAQTGRIPISPYIYGRNGLSWDNTTPEFAREAGLRIARESNGNNCTKYNWRRDLSSHPDWYNNVYAQGLHDRARRINAEFAGIQGLFGFQVLGWVARTDEANFREQEVNPRPEPRDNLCGGGDPDLYLEPWSAKDTVDILDHWFGPGGLGFDPANFRYWHLDNEPECWQSTHDDVEDGSMTAEECVQRYVAVAREAKSRYPDIRLMAPGFTSEWMWWNWNNNFVDGMPWAEYFIKRMAEESRESGIRLIDVVDYHTYIGGDAEASDVLQEYRVLYDPAYAFPRANGCKRYPDGAWNEDQRVECIFGRTEEWIRQYFGPDSGVTIGVTEAASSGHGPMVDNLWYASMLGTFADHGVEVFTPWGWNPGFWEVLHLFSRYGQETRVAATCAGEPTVSAYASVSPGGAGMTVILLNRDGDGARSARVSIAGFDPAPGPWQTLTLAELPVDRETFVSHTENALREGEALAGADGTVVCELPPYSITAIVIPAR